MGKYEINKLSLSLSKCWDRGFPLARPLHDKWRSWRAEQLRRRRAKPRQGRPSQVLFIALQCKFAKDTTLLDWRGATLVWLPLPSRVAFSSLGKRPKAWENYCVIATPFPLPLLPTLCVAQLIREWTIIARVHCGWALCEGCAAKLTYWQKTKDQKEETRLQTANWNANQVSRETAKRLKAKS